MEMSWKCHGNHVESWVEILVAVYFFASDEQVEKVYYTPSKAFLVSIPRFFFS